MQTKGQSSKQKRARSDTLVEALRGFGGSTIKSLDEDFLNEIPNDIFAQTGLRPKNNQNRNQFDQFSESSSFKEQTMLQERLRRTETVRTQEQLIFTAKERETKTQVESLVAEVKNLAKAVGNLDQKVQVAAIQAPVEPGIYHVNFFQKLISFIRSLTAKIEDSTAWLSAGNAKAKKRSHYWGQVQKSGTKFMLSQERYMSTQAG